MQAASTDALAANGYATLGYSPAIFSIPNRPFTARRDYKEWARSSDSKTPIVTTTVTIARDSAGRIHYESSHVAGDVIVRVSDPVQHLNYQYEVSPDPSVPMTVQQCTQPLMAQISGPIQPGDASESPTANTAPLAPAAQLPTASKTELGSKTMEGTLAYGQQRTDYLDLQPGVLTMQKTAWFSPDLGLNLLLVSDYSNQNKFSEDTHNVKLGDPDTSLFSMPAGYTLSGTIGSCVPLMNP